MMDNVTHLNGARTENELQIRQPAEVKNTNCQSSELETNQQTMC
jgi:hypothetical protein